MSSLPTNFEFNSNTIRVVTIDGEPWFVASEVCRVLGLTNIGMALSNINNSDVGEMRLSSRGGRPNKIISEGGLYKLTFRSTKPTAREFTDWVSNVVLPAIRKDGGYIMDEEKVATGEMTDDELIFKAMEVMKRKVDRLSKENEAMDTVDKFNTSLTIGQRLPC